MTHLWPVPRQNPFSTRFSSAQEQIVLQRQITATDTQIDHLVYVLYGLTEEEIKIVEEAGK